MANTYQQLHGMLKDLIEFKPERLTQEYNQVYSRLFAAWVKTIDKELIKIAEHEQTQAIVDAFNDVAKRDLVRFEDLSGRLDINGTVEAVVK